jgi:hypothetical protein
MGKLGFGVASWGGHVGMVGHGMAWHGVGMAWHGKMKR